MGNKVSLFGGVQLENQIVVYLCSSYRMKAKHSDTISGEACWSFTVTTSAEVQLSSSHHFWPPACSCNCLFRTVPGVSALWRRCKSAAALTPNRAAWKLVAGGRERGWYGLISKFCKWGVFIEVWRSPFHLYRSGGEKGTLLTSGIEGHGMYFGHVLGNHLRSSRNKAWYDLR